MNNILRSKSLIPFHRFQNKIEWSIQNFRKYNVYLAKLLYKIKKKESSEDCYKNCESDNRKGLQINTLNCTHITYNYT